MCPRSKIPCALRPMRSLALWPIAPLSQATALGATAATVHCGRVGMIGSEPQALLVPVVTEDLKQWYSQRSVAWAAYHSKGFFNTWRSIRYPRKVGSGGEPEEVGVDEEVTNCGLLTQEEAIQLSCEEKFGNATCTLCATSPASFFPHFRTGTGREGTLSTCTPLNLLCTTHTGPRVQFGIIHQSERVTHYRSCAPENVVSPVCHTWKVTQHLSCVELRAVPLAIRLQQLWPVTSRVPLVPNVLACVYDFPTFSGGHMQICPHHLPSLA